MISLLLIALPALIIECGIIIFLIDQAINSWLLFLAHITVVSALGMYAHFRAHSGEKAYFQFLLCLSTIFFGPFGIVGTLLAVFFYSFSKTYFSHDLESYDYLFPEVDKTETEKLCSTLHFGNLDHLEQNSIVPFIDILNYGSQREKQALIVLLINNYHSKFAPILKKGLNNKDNSLRVLAAMGIAQIENTFMKKAIAIESLKNKNNIDSRYLKALGNHYDEYAYSGITDKTWEQKYRDLAVTTYNQYLQLHPEDSDVVFSVGRILLRNGDYAEAAQKFEESINRGELTPSILFWYFESLYRLGQFKKLRLAAESFHDEISKVKSEIPFEILDVVNAWIYPPQLSDEKSTPVAS